MSEHTHDEIKTTSSKMWRRWSSIPRDLAFAITLVLASIVVLVASVLTMLSL